MSKDRNIQAVLRRAAEEPAFFVRLVNDRDAALAEFDLSAKERAVLASADARQLEKMVAGIRRRGRAKGLAVAGLAAAAAVGVGALIFGPAMATAGVRVGPEFHARQVLGQLARAQLMYKAKHGEYVRDLDELVGAAFDTDPREGIPYTFSLKVNGELFEATAHPGSHPDAQRVYRAGPDGAVEEVAPDRSRKANENKAP
jgi:hypothetical protein